MFSLMYTNVQKRNKTSFKQNEDNHFCVPFSQARWANRAIVCMVFPSPISSARMPFSLFSYIVASQSRPTCWYSRRLCFSRKGIAVLTFKNNIMIRLVKTVHSEKSTLILIMINSLKYCRNVTKKWEYKFYMSYVSDLRFEHLMYKVTKAIVQILSTRQIWLH